MANLMDEKKSLLSWNVDFFLNPTWQTCPTNAPEPGVMNAQKTQSGADLLSQKADTPEKVFTLYSALANAAGYPLKNVGEGEVNVVGVRGWMDQKVVPNEFNKYNDTFAVLYTELRDGTPVNVGDDSFIGSVDPGLVKDRWSQKKNKWTQTIDGVNGRGGVSHLKDGQYDYKIGSHNGYEAFNPVTAKMPVWREKVGNGKQTGVQGEDDIADSTGTGINFHAAGGKNSTVENWSEGCQVIASKDGTSSSANTEFQRFKNLVIQQDAAGNRKDTRFHYTLIDGKAAREALAKLSGLPADAYSTTTSSKTVAESDKQSKAPAAAKTLSADKESAAIAWYKNKGFGADLIKRIQVVVDAAPTGTMDAAGVQAVGAWQKNKGFTGNQLDGKFGGGTAAKSGDKQLEADIRALLDPKKVADAGKAAQNDDSAAENKDAQNAANGGGDKSDAPELAGTTATPVFDDVPEGPVMTEKNEYGYPLSKYHVGMSNTSANREEWRLHPTLRTKLAQLRELLAAENLDFFVSEGMRSPGRQQYLYDQGRTEEGKKRGGIVTNAKAWSSNHNYGCAIDFAPKNGDWNGANWTRLGELAESVGLEWGGRWTSPVDRPHVQLNGLPKASKCKEIYAKSGLEGIWSMF